MTSSDPYRRWRMTVFVLAMVTALAAVVLVAGLLVALVLGTVPALLAAFTG